MQRPIGSKFVIDARELYDKKVLCRVVKAPEEHDCSSYALDCFDPPCSDIEEITGECSGNAYRYPIVFEIVKIKTYKS